MPGQSTTLKPSWLPQTLFVCAAFFFLLFIEFLAPLAQQTVGDVLELGGHALLELLQFVLLLCQALLKATAAFLFCAQSVVQLYDRAGLLVVPHPLLGQPRFEFLTFCSVLTAQVLEFGPRSLPAPPRMADGSHASAI